MPVATAAKVEALSVDFRSQAALAEILEDKGRHGQLCDIVEQQARTLGGGDASTHARAANSFRWSGSSRMPSATDA